MNSILENIDALFAELNALPIVSLEQQKILNEKFRLEFNYNSNHLEGNTLTYGETKLLLIFDETNGNHELREYEEMKSHDVAYRLITEWANDKERIVTEENIKNLNKILLVRPFWKEALTPDGQETRRKIKIGDYKEYANSVKLPNGEIFEYASPIDTPILMHELITWFRQEKDIMHPLELASILHYRFVRIHPFDDGNGRIARLLLNYVLLYFGYPPVVIKTADKINYIRALHLADAGDINYFINYLGEQLIWSLKVSIKSRKGENIEEEEDWKKKIIVLKADLSNIESVKQAKLDTDLSELINKKILPFLFKLKNSFIDFDDLFLEKHYTYLRENRIWSPIQKDAILQSEEIKKYYAIDWKVNLIFEGFTKINDKRHNLPIPFVFVFKDLSYDILIFDLPVINKLYHQEFTEDNYGSIINKMGPIIVNWIEKIKKN